MSIHVREILEYLDEKHLPYCYLGNLDLEIETYCPLNAPKKQAVTWIKNFVSFDLSKIDPSLNLLIVANVEEKRITQEYHILSCEKPKEVFFEILNAFFKKDLFFGISKTAIVETEEIGEDVSIGHFSYICEGVKIGNHVIIERNVVIQCPTQIEDYTIIHSGVVIGTDGFGYYSNIEGLHKKVPHLGGVQIGAHVEIGANTCIDRGTMGDTIVGNNVKIDNLCHISHNVVIEDNAIVIALTLLGGSSYLGENVYVAPCAAVMNQIVVGKNSVIGIGAVVTKDVGENRVVAGVPAKDLRENNKPLI